MIAINEICPNVDDVAKNHTDFIEKRALKIINFYLEVYRIRKFKRNYSNNERLIKTLVDFKGLHGKTKTTLIKVLFKKTKAPSSKKEYYLLRHDTKLKDQARDNEAIIEGLKALRDDLKDLLNLDFHVNPIDSNRNYNIIETSTNDISFLYDTIFDYGWFSNLLPDSDWSTYKLTESLNLKVCVYCNINYTYTVFKDNSKFTRPDLDHFLPKEKHPLLALNFHNLIPSCTVCNSRLKGREDFNYEDYISPYEDNPKHSYFEYDYLPLSVDGALGKSEEVNVELKPKHGLSVEMNTKVEGNIRVFKLNEIAEQHKDFVKDIIHKRVIPNDKMIKIIKDNFEDAELTFSEAYRYIYSTYFNEKDFAKRSFSKMTKDIAYNLKNIKEFK